MRINMIMLAAVLLALLIGSQLLHDSGSEAVAVRPGWHVGSSRHAP